MQVRSEDAILLTNDTDLSAMLHSNSRTSDDEFLMMKSINLSDLKEVLLWCQTAIADLIHAKFATSTENATPYKPKPRHHRSEE